MLWEVSFFYRGQARQVTLRADSAGEAIATIQSQFKLLTPENTGGRYRDKIVCRPVIHEVNPELDAMLS